MSRSDVTQRRETLYDISAEMMLLHSRREEAEYEGDVDAAAVIDAEIQRYLNENLPQKVDSIRGYLADQANAEAAHRAEADFHIAAAARAKNNIERVRGYCLGVMQHFGQKAYKGALHTIRRKANGGVRPLEIRQPELVPDQYRRVTITMSLDAWRRIVAKWTAPGEDMDVKEAPHEPWIRAALERGSAVPGCTLLERGEHLEVE